VERAKRSSGAGDGIRTHDPDLGNGSKRSLRGLEVGLARGDVILNVRAGRLQPVTGGFPDYKNHAYVSMFPAPGKRRAWGINRRSGQ
jgi:hypothetical protein